MMIAPLQPTISYHVDNVEKQHIYEHQHHTKSSRKSKVNFTSDNTSIKKNSITSTSSGGRQRSKTYVTNPTDYDVLCIKDKTWARHVGNRIYRERVLTLASQYDSASKQDKMKLTRSIVQLMQNKYYSRFLRQVNDDVWEIITDKQARDKTSHALRFAAKTKATTNSFHSIADSVSYGENIDVARTAIPSTISSSNSFDDVCCEQTIVSTTSTYDQKDQERQERNDSTDDSDEGEEEESLESQDDEDLESEEKQDDNQKQMNRKTVHWNDDSFLLKCATIVEVDPKELDSTDEYDSHYGDLLFRKQQSRLQYMQRQYQDQHNQDDENAAAASQGSGCIPEDTYSSADRWSCNSGQPNLMKSHTNEATNRFLDMSLSLDDIFSYPQDDPILIDTSATTAAVVTGVDHVYNFDQHQGYDDLQLDFFEDRY